MKKTLIALAALVAATLTVKAETYTIKTQDGQKVGVEVCTDNIYRIHVSPRNDFQESLQERYGILKTDWEKTASTGKTKGGNLVVSAGNVTVTVSGKNGAISVAKDGKSVIRNIEIRKPNSKDCEKLAEIINEKFSNMTVASNGGIIGDDNGKFSEKDKQESGDVAKSSIISISLEKDECLYGGGSTSRDHIMHRGEILRMWTTYQHTEIPIPFMLSSRGWGVLNNTTRKNYFDCGSYQADRLNIYNTCDESDFYIYVGDSMKDIIGDYTLTSGRTYVLPKWAYGLGFGPNMREDQFNILTDAVLFRQCDVPCDFMWLEPQWMSKRYDFSTAKTWNFDKFSPEPYWVQNKPGKQEYPRLFIGKLHAMGYKLGLWLCEEYDLSITEEDAIAAREGKPQSGEEHWMDHLKTFLDYGVDGFKLDPARTIDEHTFWTYYNGCTDKEMHNLNQVLLPKQLVDMARAHTGKRTWHHYCGGWTGIQHWGAATSGDNGGGKTALFDQINLGMSGYMNTSCDVMSVSKEQEMQSLHFGVFLPWMQINSWFSMMQPFYYGDEEQDVYRKYIKTRYEMMPYIYSLALNGYETGLPIVRSMPLEFPEDRNIADECWQYMFGENLLVGIFSNEIYLPAGTWTDAWTGERIVSKGERITHEYPADRAGLLFFREGAVIPTLKPVSHVGTKAFKDLILKVYPCGTSSYTMLEDDGDSYEFEKGGIQRTTFTCEEKAGSVVVTIGAAEGSFKGMAEERSFEVQVYCGSEPKSVLVGGDEVKDWTYENSIVKVALAKVASRAGETVTINY